MCVPIQRVHRDPEGVVTHVGGSTQDGVPWGLTVAQAIALYEAKQYTYFVEVPTGERVSVLVRVSSAGHKYLTTSPDGLASNNLDSLPNMPNPLSGVEPPFPLNIPGPLTGSLMRVTSLSYAASHQLHPLISNPLEPVFAWPELNPPASMWTQQPRLFYLDATVPFPADYLVFQNALSLNRVGGDDVTGRRALEAAGKGWWSLDFVLTGPDGNIDPSKPSRLTEVKVVIRPGANAWLQQNFTLSLGAFSINPYCPRQGNSVGFRIRKPAAPAPPPTPTTTMPSVVGQRLNTALIALNALGLTKITVLGPAALAADLKVDAQDPAAGAVVHLTDPVSLRTSLATVPQGVKTVIVSNSSNRAKPMDVWLYDSATGTWDKKGSVAYGGQLSVSVPLLHACLLAAVDPTMLNCHTGLPDELPCVYQATPGSFLGDANGITVPWQIV